MSKKKRIKNQKSEENVQLQNSDFKLEINERWLLICTLALAGIYFIYSYVSQGFYQHDEVSHFLNMRRFWHDPSFILGNWAKTGYKIFFVIPALLGVKVVHFLNAVIAAFSCYAAYKLSQKIDSRLPLLAFVILATQPFWIQLSYRSYAETTAAFLLILSVYFHMNKQPLWAALILSYNVNVRQELFPIWGLYILWLLWKRQWIPFLAMGLFPILYNIWGWAETGDILYLKNQMFGTIAHIQEGFGSGAMGFWHYPKMSIVVFGAVTVLFIIIYLGQVLLYKKSWHPFIFIPALVFFGQYCIFQIQSVQIGPSGAGNLRYMIIISPLLAVLASIAIERMREIEDRKKLLFLLIPFVIVVILFMKFQHNNLSFTNVIDPIPVIAVLTLSVITFLKLKARSFTYLIVLFSLIFALVYVKPLKLSTEDMTVKRVVTWAKRNHIEDNKVLVNHSLFQYYYGKDRYEFKNGGDMIDTTTVAQAPVGSLIIWDSHYSYKPNRNKAHLNYDYYTAHPEAFQMLTQPVMSRDRRFGVMIFRKIGEVVPE